MMPLNISTTCTPHMDAADRCWLKSSHGHCMTHGATLPLGLIQPTRLSPDATRGATEKKKPKSNNRPTRALSSNSLACLNRRLNTIINPPVNGSPVLSNCRDLQSKERFLPTWVSSPIHTELSRVRSLYITQADRGTGQPMVAAPWNNILDRDSL